MKPLQVESIGSKDYMSWRVLGEPGAFIIVSYGVKAKFLMLSTSRGSSKFITKGTESVKIAYLKNISFRTFR